MENFFIIPNSKIDPAWNPPDRSLELFVQDYCEEELDIPLYYIEYVQAIEDGLEIMLVEDLENEIIGEDWYINLFRISIYAKAS